MKFDQLINPRRRLTAIDSFHFPTWVCAGYAPGNSSTGAVPPTVCAMLDSAASAIASIREWIAAKNPNAGPIDLDVDLIETRAIDSLQFAEFVFLLEEITGRPIDLADVNLDAFRSVRSISAHFLNRLDQS